MNHLEAARLYHARAESSPAERSRWLTLARRHYARSQALDDQLPETPAMLGATYLLDGEQASRGLRHVAAAARLMPASLDIELLRARLEARRGGRAAARLLAADVLSRGHDPARERAARELLDSLH